MLSAIAYRLFPCSLRLDGLPFSSSVFGTWDPAWCAQAHKSGLLGLALHGCVGVALGVFLFLCVLGTRDPESYVEACQIVTSGC